MFDVKSVYERLCFIDLCTKLLSAGGRTDYYIAPFLVNLDVAENEFNQ